MANLTRKQARTAGTSPPPDASCPGCGAAGMTPFYAVHGVPVHSNLLLRDRQDARDFPKGDIELGFCGACGFISNLRFDAALLTYTTDYEETQGFSARFNAFATGLAERLVAKYDLRGKDILEIGCGKGEFLALLCELGENRGTGIDPTSIPGRLGSEREARISFIQDFYSENYAHLAADFVCCRHTLEHIQPTHAFLTMLRDNLGERTDTVMFFEVPDVSRVLRELAFWDVYYEHCSYFSLGSLARLFRSCGFEVLDLTKGFDDQYLLIEARPAARPERGIPAGEDDRLSLAEDVKYFQEQLARQVALWREQLDAAVAEGRRVALWGSGSKAVAYLHTLAVTKEIEYVVDINPFKQDMYLAGTGHRIVAPEFLRQYRPDVVIAMNSIYLTEIGDQMRAMGVEAELRGL